MIDATRRGSAGWWLERLIKRLAALRSDYETLDAYYTCTAGIPTTSSKQMKQAYQRLMQVSRTNFAELIVEAVRERLEPVNFRTGAAGDEQGDREAWRVWQANQLDADSALVHRWALTKRDAYVIVGQPDPELEAPLITIEDPDAVVVEYEAARRRKPRAALKLVRDDEAGLDIAYLYLTFDGEPWVLRATRALTGTRDELARFSGFDWADQAKIPAPQIPIVGFHNRHNGKRSWGEFEPHLALLDRINSQVLLRMEIATMQAFKQRAIKGAPAKDPQTGQDVDYSDIFDADPGAIWQIPAATDMWESGAVDLGPLQNAIKDDVRDLAAVTRTPAHYLIADAANQSAEGASLSREGLVYKVEDRQRQFGESWEQVMALAFAYAGDTERARRADLEIVWADPERFSLAERADAVSKLGDVLPRRTQLTDVMGYSPQAADRIEADRQAQTFLEPEPLEQQQFALSPGG